MSRKKISDEKLDHIKRLHEDMCKWEYSFLIDGKRLNSKDIQIEVLNKYRTLKIKEAIDNRCGVCWDFVNVEHYVFNKYDLAPHKCYYMEKCDLSMTHTFLVYNDGGNLFWLESAWDKFSGIHKISESFVRRYDDCVLKIASNFSAFNDVISNVRLWEYNPEGMEDLTSKEFMERVYRKGRYIGELDLDKGWVLQGE